MQDIDSILDGETSEEKAEVTETQETPETTAETEQVETKGEETPEGEAEASEQETPTASESPSLEELKKQIDGLQAATIAERKKRQEAEQKLQSKQEMPDVFENQEAFTQAIQGQIQSAQVNAQANISEFLARRDFPDLDAKIEKFKELQEADPTLAQRVRASVSPFHEIADIVTKAEKLAKLDDVDKMESEIRAKVEAEVRAKIEAEMADKQKLAGTIPQSLSDEASTGSIKANTYAGPTPLDNLIQ